jgi:hypothetical protein
MAATVQPYRDLHPDARSDARKTLSRRVLLDALFLGGLADALVHDGTGLGSFVWMIAFAAALYDLVRLRGDGMTREQRGWLATALFFAASFAWRDSSALGFFNFVAMLAALTLLGATLSKASPMRSILGQRVRDVAWAFGKAVKDAGLSIVPLALLDGEFGSIKFRRGSRARALLRAAVITLPLMLLFGALFTAADPLFGALLLPNVDFGVVGEHLALAGFFAWIVGGWLRGALVDERATDAVRAPSRVALTLGTIDVTVILGGLIALFTAFLTVQVRWLFGGEGLVRATTGLGYAEYARRGFFELVCVSLLVLPLLLGTWAAIPANDAAAVRRHRLLSIPVLVLVGGVMASALARMGLYVHYFGMSTDRLFATVFMAWLAIVFAWFGLTVLRGRPRDFVSGMTITGFLTLAAVTVANPDALVARVNVGRARAALELSDRDFTNSRDASTSRPAVVSPIDYEYLSRTLDGDAVPALVDALVAPPAAVAGARAREAEVRERCRAVGRVLERWAPATSNAGNHRELDWRQWNAGAWSARRSVRTHEAALRRVTCWDGWGEMPFGNREGRRARPGEQDFVTH